MRVTVFPFVLALALATSSSAAELWSSHHTGGIEFAAAVSATCDGGAFLSISREGSGPLVGRINGSGKLIWGAYFDATPDEMYDIVETRDGGMAGCGRYLQGNEDVWVVRFDAQGRVVWNRRYGGPGLDRGSRIVVLQDGGFLVAGRTTSFGAGGTDVWLLRLDSAGNVLWQKTYGGPLEENVSGGFSLSGDGGGLLTGRTTSFGAGTEDAWFVRVDPQGNILWQFALGGTGAERTFGVGGTPDGGFLAGGRTTSAGAGSTDGWVIKLASDGTVAWQRTIGAAAYDSIEGVTVRPDGTAVLLGATESYPALGQIEPSDFSLTGVDASGGLLWHRIMGTPYFESTGRIATFSDRSVIWTGTAGMFPYSAWTVRTDASGVPAACEASRSVSPTVSSPMLVRTPTSVVPGVSSASSVSVPWLPVAYAFLPPPVCTGGRPGEVSPPYAVQPLVFDAKDTLHWEGASESGAQTFDVFRGSLAFLPGGAAPECLMTGIAQTTWVDGSTPGAGEGWFYVIRGTHGGGSGTLGHGSDCRPRWPASTCEGP